MVKPIVSQTTETGSFRGVFALGGGEQDIQSQIFANQNPTLTNQRETTEADDE
jgi:hypothetical protein